MFYLTLVAVLNLLCFVSTGDVPLTDRIVGGSDANIQDLPFLCSLQEKGSHVCGCSILAPTVIATAAHCVDDVDPKSNDLEVRCGSAKHDAGGVVKGVKSFQMHPFYNPDSMEYDFAFLNLQSPLIFSSTIKKIELAKAPPEDGSSAIVAGWGFTDPKTHELSPSLKKADVNVLTQESCQKSTGYGKNIKESMFCAKGKGTDACEGDSGGPIVSSDKMDLIGVVSFGFECGSDKHPGVYTLTHKCLPFIEKMMKTL